MSGPFTASLAVQPSARLLVDRMADEATQGRSVVTICPTGVPMTALHQAACDALYARGVVYLPIDCWPTSAGGLSTALGLQLPTASAELAGVLQGLAECHAVVMPGIPVPNDWPAVVGLLNQWSSALRSWSTTRRPPVFVAIVSGSVGAALLPSSEVGVSQIWWNSVHTPMDLRFVCRLESAALGDALVGLWREALLPELAGTDLELADRLWDRLELDSHALRAELSAHAHTRGWTQAGLERVLPRSCSWRHGVHPVAPDRLPSEQLAAWADGLLQWTLEHGLEVSAAGLALLDRSDRLKHRVWRGQAALLLPIVDAVRARVCRLMTIDHGPQWATRFVAPDDSSEKQNVEMDPLSCQLGHLCLVLQRVPDRHLLRPLLVHLRDIRNDLAHYRCVEFRDVEGIRQRATDAGVWPDDMCY